ncbi:MAG: hypothetical protein JNK72_13085 [Myxococcales bacterium]|nr:hypothetical protein [Myxococcales bacterium]
MRRLVATSSLAAALGLCLSLAHAQPQPWTPQPPQSPSGPRDPVFAVARLHPALDGALPPDAAAIDAQLAAAVARVRARLDRTPRFRESYGLVVVQVGANGRVSAVIVPPESRVQEGHRRMLLAELRAGFRLEPAAPRSLSVRVLIRPNGLRPGT